MNYLFPEIKNIKQASEAIKDRPEFIEVNRDDYVVFNYILSHEDSFDDPMRRELRGLIFNRSGDVLSRRFHKFFNMNEKEETQSNNIDWNKPHVVLEKLDGSMITPLVINGEVRWATKMGITEVAIQCEEFLKGKDNYHQFALNTHTQKVTPIFEFIAPDNRIVISYEEPKLILLALRNNLTGKYYNLDMMKLISEQYNIPMVKTYSGDISNIRDQVGIEGVVVRFDDGHMVKVKTDWYVAIHKAKDQILFEKNVIKLIFEEKTDDILPNLLDSDKIRINSYKEILVDNIDLYVENIRTFLETKKNDISRKEFALDIAPNLQPIIRNVYFTCWNGDKDIRTELIKNILKYTNSQNDVDSIRFILPEEW